MGPCRKKPTKNLGAPGTSGGLAMVLAVEDLAAIWLTGAVRALAVEPGGAVVRRAVSPEVPVSRPSCPLVRPHASDVGCPGLVCEVAARVCPGLVVAVLTLAITCRRYGHERERGGHGRVAHVDEKGYGFVSMCNLDDLAFTSSERAQKPVLGGGTGSQRPAALL